MNERDQVIVVLLLLWLFWPGGNGIATQTDTNITSGDEVIDQYQFPVQTYGG